MKRGRFLSGSVVLSVLLAWACSQRQDAEDTNDGGTMDGAGASGASTGSTNGGSTGNTGGVCDNPAYDCAPHPCEDEPEACGPRSPFDENGCLRTTCTDDGECEEGQRCYVACRFGDCNAGWIESCSDDYPDAPGECVCVHTGGVICDDEVKGICVEAEDYPTEPPSTECGGCGTPGTHSEQVDGECVCDPGYTWCDDDPDDFNCCMDDGGVCPDPNSYMDDGLCYCNVGYEWCNPDDPNDLTCCEIP